MTYKFSILRPTMPGLAAALAVFFLAAALLYPLPAIAEKPAANRLAREKSPYLLRHATNPVDWFPWGEEAFAKAATEDKPIFLSIGYSTCHWCSVMEEESFSDPTVAALMNQTVVAVKVDREERPDIDQLYMSACRLLSSSCGWPLTIIMTPDKQPFLIATYLPREDKTGQPGLLTLLAQITKDWGQQREELLRTARMITDELTRTAGSGPAAEATVDRADLAAAYQKFSAGFDPEYGGFGSTSKFPEPQNLMFLLRYHHRSGEAQALAMVEKSLQAMRLGAIYDQLGHGFHRYATDRAWRLPHFEKMLSDQALLTLVYLETFQATGNQEYSDVAREIIDFVSREMTSAAGAFYTALSADSGGGEGKFYLWQEEELKRLLNKEEMERLRRVFNIEAAGNSPNPTWGEKSAVNVLYRQTGVELPADFSAIRSKLLAARAKRPRPALDDKVLTDWNGLMIGALARAALTLDKPAYGETASRAADFILKNMRKPSGRLLHRWREGQAGLTATAADYAYLIWGLIELYEWSFDARWLEEGLKLNSELIEHYWDNKDGGFFLTPNDGEALPVRVKPVRDEGLPSANSVALMNLYRLSRLTSQPGFEEKAAALVKAFSGGIKKAPVDYPMLLSATAFILWPSHEVVIAGKSGAADTTAMLKALRARFHPDVVVQFRPAEQERPAVLQYAPFIEFMAAAGGKATAYVCTDFNCKLPTTDIERMLHLLQPPAGGR